VTRGETAFAVISGLLINEATDICPWLAIRLVRWAARRRYPHAPERAATRSEELAAVINDRPGKLFKLFTALGLALHALVVLSGWRAAAKRTVDIGVAAVALAWTLPLWAVIAAAIRLTSKGPVFFQQERVTKDGRVFRMYKFRTMRIAAATITPFQLGAERRPIPGPTPVGQVLRRFEVDELPQLLNVLKGDMNLVGPRPARPKEVDAYKDWQRDRLKMRSGVTGLWQVGNIDRSKLSFDDHVRMDLFYIKNWSLAYDLCILIKTIWVSLRRNRAD
jgi:lipopolysaccharide/colanic/teichoic acid biosynthesis glycosyltransferase